MIQRVRSIEVFAEIACPFTHACIQTIVAERMRRGMASPRLRLRAWPLELVNGRAFDPRRVAAEITALRAQVAPDLFQATDATHVPSSSIGAFGLAAAAYRKGNDVGEAVSLAIRHAMFEAGRDLVDDVVLSDIGAPFHVQALSLEDATAAVEADWAIGRGKGVKGSPHFFVDDRAWFSPSLEINKERGERTIRRDDATLADFYAAAFGDSPSD